VPGAATYGTGGARISSQDGTTIRLEPSGKLTVLASVTEQGQGTDTILAQVAAATVGVAMEDVAVVTGDTMVTPYGGGTWGSRGAGIGGEATLQTGKALKENILKVAAVMLEVDALALDIRGGQIVDARTGEVLLPLSELGRVAYFRPDTLPKDFQSELTVTRHYVPRHQPLAYTERRADLPRRGRRGHRLREAPRPLGGGGLRAHHQPDARGRAGARRCRARPRRRALRALRVRRAGQLLTTTMMDYLVPMAVELPDIGVAHVETPTAYSEGGFKGAGEGGVAGAPGAVLNAVNDALSPLGARVTRVPMTPEVILRALGKL
jgi:carbon-monoxide dehydrogenase large subunit